MRIQHNKRIITLSCVAALAAGTSIIAPLYAQDPESPDRTQQQHSFVDQPQDSERVKKERVQREGREKRRDPAHRKQLEIRIDPDALRARLNRSILNAENLIERHQNAIEKLDSGASPAEVLKELRLRGITREHHEPRPEEHMNPLDSELEAAPRSAPPPSRHEIRENRPGRERSTTVDDQIFGTFMEQNFPNLWANFVQMRSIDSRSADRLMAGIRPKIQEIIILSQTQPDLAKIKLKEMRSGLDFAEASRVYRQLMRSPETSPEDLDDALKSMEMYAQDRVSAQIEAKRFEIQRLEARLNELKDAVNLSESEIETEVEKLITRAKERKKREKPQD